MPSLTIRDIPEDLHARLKADAAAQGRSLNKEVLVRLKLSVTERRPAVEELLAVEVYSASKFSQKITEAMMLALSQAVPLNSVFCVRRARKSAEI